MANAELEYILSSPDLLPKRTGGSFTILIHMSTYLETLVKKTASMVDRWQGRRARMLELTSSHTTLAIVVGDDTYGENLLIACLGPVYICGPVQWESSAIALEPTQLDSGEQGIAVVDKANGVRVLAESFEVKENVKW